MKGHGREVDEPDGVGRGKETLGPEQRASGVPCSNLDAVPHLLLGALSQGRGGCCQGRGSLTSEPSYVLHRLKEERVVKSRRVKGK